LEPDQKRKALTDKLLEMFRKFKYDVAFSFVQEDIEIVEKVAEEFKKVKGFKYYLYTEREEDVGDNIFRITNRVYPRSRYVLIFTSKNFINGFWARVERMLMSAYIERHLGRVIQVRLDNTIVDGLSRDIAGFKWNSSTDPERIAGVLVKKVLKQKAEERKRRLIAASSVALLLAVVVACYWPVIKSVVYPIHQLSPVLVKGMVLYGQPTGSNINNSSYYINQTEVTVGEYRKYCDSKKQRMPPQPWPVLKSNPVVNVSWQDAMAFCRSKGGRLPTEEEWEYAASANLQTKYAGGNNASKVAVYSRQSLRPVATKQSNAFGLYDMSGNVGEWTSTSVDEYDIFKIVKGGEYRSGIASIQITSRDTLQVNEFNKYTGFRIAWDHKP
jgi:formylglycine-generating enzyme